jgi:hypothetical protein
MGPVTGLVAVANNLKCMTRQRSVAGEYLRMLLETGLRQELEKPARPILGGSCGEERRITGNSILVVPPPIVPVQRPFIVLGRDVTLDLLGELFVADIRRLKYVLFAQSTCKMGTRTVCVCFRLFNVRNYFTYFD